MSNTRTSESPATFPTPASTEAVPGEQKFVSWEAATEWLIGQPEHADLVRDCYFDRPVIGAARRYYASEEWAALRRILPQKPGTAIDIGAGNGIVSYALAKDGWQVTALEPDPSDYVGAGAIRKMFADEGMPIDVIESFGEGIPVDDEAFDVVLARQVMHHAQDLAQMSTELTRILKSGGLLVTFRDHVIDTERDLDLFLANHPLHRLYGGENAFTLKQYRGALEAAGLVIRRQWNHFDSVVNYGPRSLADYRRQIAARFPAPWLGNVCTMPLRSDALFGALLRLAGRLSRTPGRLVSFICEKP